MFLRLPLAALSCGTTNSLSQDMQIPRFNGDSDNLTVRAFLIAALEEAANNSLQCFLGLW